MLTVTEAPLTFKSRLTSECLGAGSRLPSTHVGWGSALYTPSLHTTEAAGPPQSSPNLSVLPVQVVEETQVILREYGFRFVRRGPIFVKGKGELLTFFLKGRDRPAAFPNGSSVTLPHQVVDNP